MASPVKSLFCDYTPSAHVIDFAPSTPADCYLLFVLRGTRVAPIHKVPKLKLILGDVITVCMFVSVTYLSDREFGNAGKKVGDLRLFSIHVSWLVVTLCEAHTEQKCLSVFRSPV